MAPALRIGCVETYMHEATVSVNGRDHLTREKKERECPSLYLVPETVNASGRIDLEQSPRYRGIDRVHLYRAALKFDGRFRLPPAPEQLADTVRRFERITLVLPIADARGVKNNPSLTWNGSDVPFQPGTGDARLGQGLSAGLRGAAVPGQEASFGFELEVAGMERFSFVPFARLAVLKLASNWPAPSFAGKFLPDLRSVNEDSFGAEWRINDFASGGEAALREFLARPCTENAAAHPVPGTGQSAALNALPALAVHLIEPVNLYMQSYRAAEYGFLFVGLTFLLVLTFELAGAARVHPVQYGLVGLALAAFFLLLIALAEHIGFARAYLAATAGCVTLITWYAVGMLASARRGLAVGACAALLFGVLHMLLRSEDYALLMGALLVFVVLAAVMLVTRKLDWYGLGARLTEGR